MADENRPSELSKPMQVGLLVVAGASVLCALLHALYPQRVDEKTAMFLAVAIVALMIQKITKFKGFGIEIEKEVEKLKQDVKTVENAFGALEKDVGPGSKSATTPPAPPTPVAPPTPLPLPTPADDAEAVADSPPLRPIDPNDPNRGQFGGLPERNGRKLTAKIEPIAGPKSSRCRVTITVVSTDPARPLTGKVRLYLHPTFGRWASYDIDVKGGVAEEVISSYGAFTIGVEADQGATRLELNLMDVPGGTKRFYEE